MLKRSLGGTGFEIGEVGLGCWQIGGSWGTVGREDAFAILESAHLNGVDFFDTADVYGDGRSEEIIGEFCRAHGIHPVVATKYGRGPHFPDRFTEETLRAGVEASCDRLKVDRIDLLQLHCLPAAVLERGELFSWLNTLVEEGTLRNWGASVETIEEGLLCLKDPGCRSLQIIFNVLRQKPAFELLPAAAAAGVGILVRLPLASGLLSGKFSVDSRFEPTDHRTFNREGEAFNVGETFAGLPFEKGVSLVDELKAMVPQGMSMAQWALRWILDHGEVSAVIPGASRSGQVASNVSASDLSPLDAGLHAELERFYLSDIEAHSRGAY